MARTGMAAALLLMAATSGTMAAETGDVAPRQEVAHVIDRTKHQQETLATKAIGTAVDAALMAQAPLTAVATGIAFDEARRRQETAAPGMASVAGDPRDMRYFLIVLRGHDYTSMQVSKEMYASTALETDVPILVRTVPGRNGLGMRRPLEQIAPAGG